MEVNLDVNQTEAVVASRPVNKELAAQTFDYTAKLQALTESEEQFRTSFELAPVGIAHVSADFKWLRVNPKLCEILGYPSEELLKCSFQDITHPDDVHLDRANAGRMLAGEVSTYTVEMRNVRKDRSVIWVNLTVSLVRQPSGESKYFICVIEDITQRKRLENQLLQAQKLESVGRLAGGVAHDFNNLLTAILGYGELAEEHTSDPLALDYLRNMMQAADRAADLTRQLLSFARRQVIEPKVVNFNALILGIEKLLRRLIGEHYELILRPDDGLHSVKIDPGQFEQILVNLVVNSRDAMPNGGKITVETHNALLDEDYARHHEGVSAGEYVMLSVSDTGSGMDDAIRLHIFEPFFTTKETGRGTGLGLATVYGIVRQAGGHIWLYSEPGEGTAFKIYLPRTSEAPEALADELPLIDLSRGGETILLVEDEPPVRALAAQALRGRGYTVLEAIDGEEALHLVIGHEQEITLLITDVIMPRMNGKELADRLQIRIPGLKVVYSSGYTDNTIVHHGVLDPDVEFLSKPFTPTLLIRKVREVLDKDRTPPAG